MSKGFFLPLVFVLRNASDACRTQARQRYGISFFRKWIHNQYTSMLLIRERYPVTQTQLLPRILLHKELRTTNRIVSNRGFRLPTAVQSGNKIKYYSETRIIGHSMEHLFSTMTDFKHFKNFVPYCIGCVIASRNATGDLTADLSVGFPPFIVGTCTGSFKLTPPNMVKFVGLDGNLFNHMVTTWKLSPAPNGNPNSCVLNFDLSFEFRSSFHSQLSHIFLKQVVKETISAFSAETTRRYGKT